DLQIAYEQLCQGQPILLPAKTTSYQQWATQLLDYAQTGAADNEKRYWLALKKGDTTDLPVDHPQGQNIAASLQTIRVELSTEETRNLLQKVPEAYHTQINEILLTALVQTLTDW